MLTHLFRLPLSSASPLMCEPLARQVQAFDAHATLAEPTVRVPSLPEHEQVGWWCVGGKGCGGEEGGGGGGDCGGRANGGAGGGGPW